MNLGAKDKHKVLSQIDKGYVAKVCGQSYLFVGDGQICSYHIPV